MSVPATQRTNTLNLVDAGRNVTSALFSQFGGTETLLVEDPALTGDDATLLEDFLITHTTIENCLFFRNIDPGRYIVLVYARMPDQPDVMSQTNVDEEPGNPDELVGGAWTGEHVEGVTYARHEAIVAASGTNAGRLGMHSGVPAGGSLEIGAALNAVQIMRICDADITGADAGVSDGAVDALDFLMLIGQWGTPCGGGCEADITGAEGGPDGAVDSLDFLMLIGQWGAPGVCPGQ
jgi:hypothetical protein